MHIAHSRTRLCEILTVVCVVLMMLIIFVCIMVVTTDPNQDQGFLVPGAVLTNK